MKVVVAYPPNIDAIDAVFRVRGLRGVVFTYGDTVYNPDGVVLQAPIRAHEAVHVQRQSTPEAWWDKYMVDPEFRLHEELPAHRAEYKQLCATTKNRELCARYLQVVAHKLAAPLYGSIITPTKARGLLR